MTERPRAVRGCRLTGAMVTGLGVVGIVFLPAAVAGEVPPTQPPPTFGNDLILLTRFEPWMIMVMVLGVLAALMGSLWMIYLYIARVRTTEIHRQLLLEAVTEFQYLKLRGNRGPIITSTGSSVITGETPEQRIEREKRIREENERRQQEAENSDKQQRDTARKDAEILVPQSLSVAGMGITGSFFIELTAILTIIFGILILGLLGVLGTREISPILAAIAGYVLGKTTSGQTSPAVSPTPQPAPGLIPQSTGGQVRQSATP